MTPEERRALDALDVDAMLGTLEKLIAVPTLSGQETPGQELVADLMREIGLTVDVWEIDVEALARHPAYCAEVERRAGLGVVGALGDGQGASLALNAHVDVVPPGDPTRWRYPPWSATRVGDRVYGRGTADTKGGLAAALHAARAVRDAGIRLPGRFLIQSVIGEEDGGCGTLATLLRGHRADGAVVIEPTALAVAPAQAGALNFRITVPGRAAHGSLRLEGVDPVEKFIPLFEAIRALERDRNRRHRDPLFASYDLPWAICMGTVRAGTWASSVAESLTVEGRLGVPPDEDPDAARRCLEETIAAAAARDPWLRDHPPALEWWAAQFAPARTPDGHPLVSALRRAAADATGIEPELRGAPYGSDMRLMVNEGGVPAVLFGPGDIRRAHETDEYVPVADLVAAARTFTLLALRTCRE